MKYRKLRIAWSVAWGILAVLLIVLWVRGGFSKFLQLEWQTLTATGATFHTLYIPYWQHIAFCTALAGLPWIRWSNRFTLRTLLIATTLVAVLLGLIVWLR